MQLAAPHNFVAVYVEFTKNKVEKLPSMLITYSKTHSL